MLTDGSHTALKMLTDESDATLTMQFEGLFRETFLELMLIFFP